MTLYTQNVAITFMKEMPDIIEVQAWDGYASYIPILGWEFSSQDEEFQKWSIAKNGYNRNSGGKITYYRDGSIIEFTPKVKTDIKFIRHHDNSIQEEYVKQHNITEIIK